jgi:poly(A) polymerase
MNNMEIMIKKELSFSSKNLEKILIVLNKKAESRIIGGAVRDAILGIQKSDIDIATTILPNQVMDILQKENIKTLPTGIDHGTVTAFIESEIFEITTLRKDVECFGRKASIKFTDSFEEDAQRRDFSINSLSYDFNKKIIYDYTGGYEDLINSKVLFIGLAEDRIKEDYLRILRFFRFSSNYAETFDQQALEACKKLSHNINQLSKERVNTELKKIIDSKKFIETINIMIESKITNHIFGELVINSPLHKNTTLTTIEKLFLLLKDNAFEKINNTLKFLRFSNKEIIHIKELKQISNDVTKDNIEYKTQYYKLSNNLYLESFLRIFPLIQDIDIEAYKIIPEKYKSISIPKLPIDGFDLKNVGFSGKQIHATLEKAKELWIKNNFKLSKQELITDLKGIYHF